MQQQCLLQPNSGHAMHCLAQPDHEALKPSHPLSHCRRRPVHPRSHGHARRGQFADRPDANVEEPQEPFAFNTGFGNNTVTDFNTSRDVLQFNHALFVNFAAAMADTKQVGANTAITYDANDSVALTGVAASHLTASNFKLT